MLTAILNKVKKSIKAKAAQRYSRKTFLSDADFNAKYGLSNGNLQDNRLGRIMLLMHALEKGMTFSNGRTFGEDKSKNLQKELACYLSKYEMNDICIIALNVLHEYISHPNSTQNADVRKNIQNLLDVNSSYIKAKLAGTQTIYEPPVFDRKTIETFFATRSSIREYSDEEVSNAEIESAMHIASYTPSACNRQASRIHVYKNPATMQQMMQNQLGNQNWCQNAKALIVVTVNICYFGGGYEHLQAFIDGGLYAMNFVHGLHLNHVATCFKMFIREHKIEKDFKRIAGIPDYETPIVLILAGHYKHTPILSPKSKRIPFAMKVH